MTDDQPDTFTRESLLRARGYPDEVVAGNGHAGTAGPVTEPTTTNGQRVCALDGCSTVVVGGHGARFCSDAHRRRASHLRSVERESRREGVTSEPAVDGVLSDKTPSREPLEVHPTEEVPAPRVVNGSGPWEVLSGVAAVLPAGWQLTATAVSVTVSWQAPGLA